MEKNTQAYLVGTEIMRVCEDAVLVGSSAYHKEPTNVDRDIDIAVNFEDLIDNYVMKKHRKENNKTVIALVREFPGEHSEDGTSVKYTNKGIVSQCSYKRNKKTRWIGVEKITFQDGSSLDLLYYSKENMSGVKQTMKMLLANPYIWDKKSKATRVKLYEKIVSTLCKKPKKRDDEEYVY